MPESVWVALIGAAGGVLGALLAFAAARVARKAQRETAQIVATTPSYDSLARRVEYLEDKTAKLEADLEAQRESEARARAAYRGRIHILMRYIEKLIEYAEQLAALLQLDQPSRQIPKIPSLPDGFDPDTDL